jgi:hypothetical protein
MDQVTLSRAAAEQVLEALEYENSWHAQRKEKPYVSTLDAINVLCGALEQPEQAEPPKFEAVPYPEVQPYPFEMPPLTPEQLARVSAGRRALKLTMTEVEQPEQAEPVSTWYGTDWPAHMQLMAQLAHLEPGTDLYTHPPHREPKQEQPEQELKPFNGLTKEEALAWARGLRIDSPPQPEKDWKALYHAQVQITEAAQRRANYTLELMNSMLEKQEQTEPTMTESTIPDGPTIPDGRWIVEVSSRVLKAWPISEQDAMRIAFAQPGPEPVARFDERYGVPVLLASAPMLCDGQLLYADPRRREWESLSEEEIHAIEWHGSPFQFARSVEAKLKEKNHEDK